MLDKFFRTRLERKKIETLNTEIKEISIITPFFLKGQLESVWELMFRCEYYFISGETLYKKYVRVLLEADSSLISENIYKYKNYNKRVLLNYCLGFMRSELKKAKT